MWQKLRSNVFMSILFFSFHDTILRLGIVSKFTLLSLLRMGCFMPYYRFKFHGAKVHKIINYIFPVFNSLSRNE